MKERPILFSAPMLHALLAGTKTQTRRVVALPRSRSSFVLEDHGNGWWPYQSDDGESSLCNDGMEHPYASPYGQPGDKLWVREAWRAPTSCDRLPPRSIADSEGRRFVADEVTGPDPGYGRFRQGMFMPRWASRILLDVVNVRVERLQDISESDARAEGYQPIPRSVTQMAPVSWYRTLWEELNGAGSWAANPWVWVVEFRPVEQKEGAR